MKNQLFKTIVAPNILWDFLKENGENQGEYYIFTKPLYKKACFNNNILPFIQGLEEYYYDSKKHYITRKIDYAKFITIIRQLCNSLEIVYTTQLIYNNSTYEIVYFIYTNVSSSLTGTGLAGDE
jgi:hypothetical protein